jgi:hypothetical protein
LTNVAAEEGFTDTKGLAKHFQISVRKIRSLKEQRVLPWYEIPRRCIRFKIKECDEAMRAYRHQGIAG